MLSWTENILLFLPYSHSHEVLILRPVTMTETGSRLAAVRRKINDLGMEPADIDRAIAWARGGQGRRR